MRSLLLVGLLAVCGPLALAQALPKVDEKAVGLAVSDLLKDPESMRLRNVKLAPSEEPNTWHLCGEYNAKNSQGGYQGFQHFVGSAVKEGKGPLTYVIRDMGDFAQSFCTALPKS